MMVVPAPRAIRPLSFSESRPKTVRVESSTANTKPATANTPTITGREYLSCPCMGVLLLQSGGGAVQSAPTGGVRAGLSPNVEHRPVRVHATHGRLGVPVSHKVFRGNHSLHSTGTCPGAITADAQDALAAVIVRDSQNGVPIGPCAVVDQVDEAPCLKIVELPTDQFPYLVGTASGLGGTAKRLPGPTAGDTAGRPATCRPDEGPRTRELNRQGTGIAGCCECDAAWGKCGRSSCWVKADDVPADMVSSRALHHWEAKYHARQHRHRHNGSSSNPFSCNFHVRPPLGHQYTSNLGAQLCEKILRRTYELPLEVLRLDSEPESGGAH